MAEREREGLDIFKVVLVVCALACLAFGVLLYLEHGRLDAARQAYQRAEQLIPEIRTIHENILKLQAKQAASAELGDAHDYIEKYVMRGAGISRDDISFRDSERQVDKRGFQDQVYTVEFGARRKEALFLPRENIFNVLFNLESQSPQFKIGRLQLVAQEVAAGSSPRRGEDPKLLSDSWQVRMMEVVQRIPARVDVRKPR